METMDTEYYVVDTEEAYAYWIHLFTSQLNRTRNIIFDKFIAQKREKVFSKLIAYLRGYYSNGTACVVVQKEDKYYCPYEVKSC